MKSSFFVTILTLFPEVFPGILGESLSGSALKKGIWSYKVVNIRDFGIKRYRQVDDRKYGGGPGLVMRPDVLGKAIETNMSKDIKKIYYFSPRGKRIGKDLIQEVIDKNNIMVLCGRFEGIDERVIEEYSIEEVSVGDFIVSGGEVCALLLLDSCIRLLPGVVKQKQALIEESFGLISECEGLLEYPLYTRPYIWKNKKVPDVLLSGNHLKISNWKKQKSLFITKKRRPDLI